MSLKNNYEDRGQFTDPVFFSKKLKFLLIAALVLIVCFCWYYFSRQVLLITPMNANGEQIVLPLKQNEWYLSYTHSVQKTIVDECFKVQPDNTFSMYRTRYSSFGVGLPFLPGEGELVFLPNDTMQLDLKKPRTFPIVKLWTGIEAKVKLISGNDIIPIYEKYPTGTLVQISTCKRYALYCQ